MSVSDSRLPSHVEELFNGSKTFWRQRLTFDVLIVSHLNDPTIEILVYDPILNIEASHQYINRQLLDTKINQIKYLEKLTESYSKKLHEKYFNIEHQVMNEMRVEYLLNRLIIDINNDLKTITAILKPMNGDTLEEEILGQLEVMIKRPSNVLPVQLEQWIDRSSRNGTSSGDDTETSSKRLRKRLGIHNLFKKQVSKQAEALTGSSQTSQNDNSSNKESTPKITKQKSSGLSTIFNLRPLIIDENKKSEMIKSPLSSTSSPSTHRWKLPSPRLLRMNSKKQPEGVIHIQQQSGSDRLDRSHDSHHTSITASVSNGSTPRSHIYL